MQTLIVSAGFNRSIRLQFYSEYELLCNHDSFIATFFSIVTISRPQCMYNVHVRGNFCACSPLLHRCKLLPIKLDARLMLAHTLRGDAICVAQSLIHTPYVLRLAVHMLPDQ